MPPREFVADHVRRVDASGIRRVFDLGASLTDPINFSIGEPDFDVPAPVRAAMIDAIESHRTGYTGTRGLSALRERIARQLKDEFSWQPDIFVTSGVSGGLYLALLACINPGDEVLFGDPYFVSYKQLSRMVQSVPVPINQYDDFRLHPKRFEAAITNRTKMIIVGSPGNPTGIVFSEADLRELAEIARKHDLLLVSDEIYNMLSYDGPAPSIVRFAPERTILLRGYSKSYAMTGMRMGYAAGPPEVIQHMVKLQQYTYVCAPHPAQCGALVAMDTDVSNHVNDYREKRNLVCKELEGALDFVRPSGGFYVFPRAPKRFPSASAFVEAAIKRNVLTIPGNVFSERDTHFRLSYATSNPKIREGCRILRELAG